MYKFKGTIYFNFIDYKLNVPFISPHEYSSLLECTEEGKKFVKSVCKDEHAHVLWKCVYIKNRKQRITRQDIQRPLAFALGLKRQSKIRSVSLC